MKQRGDEKIRQRVYQVMERLPVATADSPKHGQPGQTSREDGVKTPWTWAVNTPVSDGEKKTKHVKEGRWKKTSHQARGSPGRRTS